jgi:dTDP-4-amino-4,6-dideoxygalactose transaminase
VVTTNDADLAESLRRFRNHGIDRMPERGGWYYEIQSLGYNYRLTDIQAALGISQISRLGEFIAQRNEIAAAYRTELTDAALTLPPAAPDGWLHGYHLFPVQVDGRDRVFVALREAGIGVQIHYVPIHHHPAYADLGQGPGELPNAELAYHRLISLPMHPTLSADDQRRVIDVLLSALE